MLLGNYGNSLINVGLRVNLVDNFSGPARQVKAAFGGLKDELKMYQENLRIARNMYGTMALAGGAATMGMVGMVRQGAKFDYLMRGVYSVAGGGIEKFKALKDEANKIGQTTMFSPTEAADAMQNLALAGLNANQVMSATSPIINLAGASLTNLGTSADIAISTMYQFGYSAKDMGKVSDLLVVAANKSNVNLTDLGESLKYVSATATDLGLSLKDTLATLMVLGNMGMKGSMAGVALENMLRYMALGMGEYAKTKRSKIWLERFGMDPQSLVDAKGNMLPLLQIFQNMAKVALGGNVNAQNTLFDLFNVRGKRAASKLLLDEMASGQGKWRQFLQMLTEAEKVPGFAEKIMKFRMAGSEGALHRLSGAWDAFKNKFTEAVAPIFVPIVNMLNTIARILGWITSTKIGAWLTGGLALSIAVGTAIWGVKTALSAVYLAQAQLKGSFGGMMTSMRMGWAQLTGDVTRYRSMMAATLLAGAVGGGIPGASANALRNLTVAQAVAAGANRTNAGIWQGANGRYFATTAGGGAMGVAGAALATNVMASSALTTMGRTGGMLAGVGSKILGFLGGPWGIALTFGLPLVISGLSKVLQGNTDAVNANTASNENKMNSDEQRIALSYIANKLAVGERIKKLYRGLEDVGQKENADFVLQKQYTDYMKNPHGTFYDYRGGSTVNIYVDGKLQERIRQTLNREISTNLSLYP